jgi:hypothetical protein
MSKVKTTLKRLEYEAEGTKMVGSLLEHNKNIGSNAGTAINGLLTEYLTEKEVRETLIKIVNRNKSARLELYIALRDMS